MDRVGLIRRGVGWACAHCRQSVSRSIGRSISQLTRPSPYITSYPKPKPKPNKPPILHTWPGASALAILTNSRSNAALVARLSLSTTAAAAAAATSTGRRCCRVPAAAASADLATAGGEEGTKESTARGSRSRSSGSHRRRCCCRICALVRPAMPMLRVVGGFWAGKEQNEEMGKWMTTRRRMPRVRTSACVCAYPSTCCHALDRSAAGVRCKPTEQQLNQGQHPIDRSIHWGTEASFAPNRPQQHAAQALTTQASVVCDRSCLALSRTTDPSRSLARSLADWGTVIVDGDLDRSIDRSKLIYRENAREFNSHNQLTMWLY